MASPLPLDPQQRTHPPGNHRRGTPQPAITTSAAPKRSSRARWMLAGGGLIAVAAIAAVTIAITTGDNTQASTATDGVASEAATVQAAGAPDAATSVGDSTVTTTETSSTRSPGDTAVTMTPLPASLGIRRTIPVSAQVTADTGTPVGTCRVERFIAGSWEVIARGGVATDGICVMTIRMGRLGKEQLRVAFVGAQGSGYLDSISPYSTIEIVG